MSIFPRIYDLFMESGERGLVGRLRHAVVSPSRGRVLEIGAGTGLDFSHYAPGTWVVATDPDLNMLRRARPRARHTAGTIVLVAADAEALPFRDAAFDDGVVGLAMCTIPHPERALAELRRAIRLGGTVRLLEHVRMELPLLGRLQDWLTPFWRRIAGGCRLNRRTVATIAASGLRLVSVVPHLGGYVQEIVARNGERP